MSVVAMTSFCSFFIYNFLIESLGGGLHNVPQFYSPPGLPHTPYPCCSPPNGNDILTLNCKVTMHNKAHRPKYVFPSKTTTALRPQQASGPIFLSLNCFQASISNQVDILIPYPAMPNDSLHPMVNLHPFMDSLF